MDHILICVWPCRGVAPPIKLPQAHCIIHEGKQGTGDLDQQPGWWSDCIRTERGGIRVMVADCGSCSEWLGQTHAGYSSAGWLSAEHREDSVSPLHSRAALFLTSQWALLKITHYSGLTLAASWPVTAPKIKNTNTWRHVFMSDRPTQCGFLLGKIWCTL